MSLGHQKRGQRWSAPRFHGEPPTYPPWQSVVPASGGTSISNDPAVLALLQELFEACTPFPDLCFDEEEPEE